MARLGSADARSVRAVLDRLFHREVPQDIRLSGTITLT